MLTPTDYFTLTPDGLPRFGLALDGNLPAGATAIGRTSAALWSQNPNLVWNAGLNAPVTPHSKVPAIDFFNLFTPAESVAIAAASVATPAILAANTHASMIGYVDLDSPLLPPWVQEVVGSGAVTADRMSYILAGMPPS